MAIRELPPEGPPQRAARRVSPVWVGLVAVVALLGLVVGWMLRELVGDGPGDRSAVPIGKVGDFPVGSLSEVEIDADFYDPYGVEDEALGAEGAPGPKPATLLVIHQEDGRVVAMYAFGRWRGCRVQPISRADAVRMFGDEVPAWFTAGLVDPCHGGLYAPTGEQIRGPGERGLDRFPVSYEADGTVLVDLTRPVLTGSLPPGGAPIDVMTGGAAVS